MVPVFFRGCDFFFKGEKKSLLIVFFLLKNPFQITVLRARNRRFIVLLHRARVWNNNGNQHSNRHAHNYLWAQIAFKDLMIHEICNSHYVSHFAAFFIVARTKISVVKSCFYKVIFGLKKREKWISFLF